MWNHSNSIFPSLFQARLGGKCPPCSKFIPVGLISGPKFDVFCEYLSSMSVVVMRFFFLFLFFLFYESCVWGCSEDVLCMILVLCITCCLTGRFFEKLHKLSYYKGSLWVDINSYICIWQDKRQGVLHSGWHLCSEDQTWKWVYFVEKVGQCGI